jgi:hypothetical protein
MSNMPISRFTRWGVAATLAASLGVVACHEALNVTNPAVIPEGSLNNELLVNTLVNSAVSAISSHYDDLAFFSAIITDEAVNGTNDYRSGELSQRIIELANADVGPYANLAVMRAVPDSLASRLKVLVASPTSDLRLARVLALAGYGYAYYGEFLCAAPINAGPMLQDDSLFRIGLDRFKQSIAIATAADTGSTKIVADSILNFARIGAGRLALDLNDKTSAIAFASAVTDPNFHWDVQYLNVSNPVNLTNSVWGHNSSGATLQLGVHPLMQHLNDPRVAYVTPAAGVNCPLGHNQLTQVCVPFAPVSYTNAFIYPAATSSANWSASGTPIGPATNMQLASGLEAQYIVAEASGPTAATTAFVNARRAFGKESPLAPGADVMAALREERRRDLYLRGSRLGDLRRYRGQRWPGEAPGVGDFFPTGTHPNTQWGLYGSATCYIITLAEMNANPNVAGYTPPSTRPPGYSP